VKVELLIKSVAAHERAPLIGRSRLDARKATQNALVMPMRNPTLSSALRTLTRISTWSLTA
jgi:hypothetical protein